MSSIAPRHPLTLLPQAVAGALILAVFLAYVLLSEPFDSSMRAIDVEAYWSAAARVRAGENLYVTRELPFTYAPWFAYLWIPLTFLPRDLVETVWLASLIGCVIWLVYPLLRSYPGLLLAMLIAPQMLEYAWIGNVDALMLVGLALAHTRFGPLFVGLAASLKITPVAFVAYYLGRGEWRRAVLACLVAVGMWVPALAYDLSTFGDAGYDATTPYSLMAYGPAVWILGNGAIIAIVAVAALRDRRYLLLASAVTAMLGNPRLNLYNLGYLVVAARHASISHLTDRLRNQFKQQH